MLTGNVRVMSAEALGLTGTTSTDTVTIPSDYTAWKQGVETTLGAHRDSITVMGGVVADLQSTVTLVSSFGYDDSYLKGQVTIANNNISSLQSSVTALGGRLNALESLSLGDYGSILSELSGVSTWSTDISSLKSVVTVLSGDVAGALEIANGASTMAQAVSKSQSSLSNSVSNLAISIGGVNSSIDNAVSSIQSNATVVSGIQNSLGSVISFVDSLDSRVSSLESGSVTITGGSGSTIPYNDTGLIGSIGSANKTAKEALSVAAEIGSIASGAADSVKSLATVVSSQGASISSAITSIGSVNDKVTLVGGHWDSATVSIGNAISSIGNLNNSVTGLNSSVAAMSGQVANFVNIPVPFVNVTGTNYTTGNLGSAINEAVKREAGSYMIGNYNLKFQMSVDNTLYYFTGSWNIFNNGKGTVSAGVFTAVPTNTSAVTADASRVYLITRGYNSAAVTLEKIYPFESSLVGLPISQAQVMRVFFSALKEVSPSNGATGINLINIGLAAAAENSGLDTWEKLKSSFLRKHKEYMTQGKSVETFLLEVCGINLTNKDTGSIIGKDAGGDVEYDAQDIVKEDSSISVGAGIELISDFGPFIAANTNLVQYFPDETYNQRHFSGTEFKDSDTGKSIIFGYWSDFPAYDPYTGTSSSLGSNQLWLQKLIISHMIKPCLQLIKEAYGLDLINDSNISHFEMPCNTLVNGNRVSIYLSIGKSIIPICISNSPHYDHSMNLASGDYANAVAFCGTLFNSTNDYVNNKYRRNMCKIVINGDIFFAEDNIVSGNLNGRSKRQNEAFFLDRTLAHELLHAVEFCCIPRWSNNIPMCLTEGLPEMMHGIDDTRYGSFGGLVSDIPDSNGNCRVKAALEPNNYEPYLTGGEYYNKRDSNGNLYSMEDIYIAGVLILRYFCKIVAASKNK